MTSYNSLFNRFLNHFHLDKTCFEDLDIVIFLKKQINQRKIILIDEIDEHTDENIRFSKSILKYTTKQEGWRIKTNLFKTN